MASKTFEVVFTNDNEHTPFKDKGKKENILKLSEYLKGLVSGARRNTVGVRYKNSAVAASGTVTIASGSGAITIVINGVTAASETWATSDTATATALAADINASTDALVKDVVTATSSAGVVTIRAVNKGKPGNCITLLATGTGATASGARLTGGTETLLTAETF